MSVIDTATNTVTATIPISEGFSSPVVLPDGSAVYVFTLDASPDGVVSTKAGTLSVIDTATNTVTATIPADDYPNYPVVSPDGSAMFVSITEGLLVIDTAKNTATATIPVGQDSGPPVVLPDGSAVYLPTDFENVSVIDTATNTVTSTIPVGGGPASPPVVLPDGSTVYLPVNEGLVVIDTATNAVTSTIPVEGMSSSVVLPDGSAVCVTTYADPLR